MINLFGLIHFDCKSDGSKPDELEAIIEFEGEYLLIFFITSFFKVNRSGTFS